MKKLLSLVFMCIGFSLFSQTADFDGLWYGNINDEDGDGLIFFIIEIEGNTATQYSYDSETESVSEYTFDQSYFTKERNNAFFFWINQGGAWTETQSFHISSLNENEAQVIWTRQVNNVQSGEDNEIWDMTGKGKIERQGSGNGYNYPDVDKQSMDHITIKSVNVSDSETKITFKFSNTSDSGYSGTFHGPDSEQAMYITNRSRIYKYELIDISGWSFGESFYIASGESFEVTLTFESIGDLKTFDLLEPGQSGSTWNFYGINLEE